MTTIAVSGSASGIGAASVNRLQRAGHRVIGIDIRDADVIADLSNDDGRAAAVDSVLDRCDGRLDGLLTAAGVAFPSPPMQIVSVNFFGSVALLNGLRIALAAAGNAKAVAISSVLTRLAPMAPAVVDACLAGDEHRALRSVEQMTERPADHAYISSKVAIARWVRRTAPTAEWIGAGIHLNAIAPGAISTPMMLHSGLEARDVLPPRSPTGRLGTPDEIAAWIEPMLGQQADFMCGSVVFVDGGLDALWRPDDWPVPAAGANGTAPSQRRLSSLFRRRRA